MTVTKNKEELSKEEKKTDDDEEVAIALVAECHVGDKKFKAGETWTDPKHDCRMSICNPGGVISYLECPRFELGEGDEIRIPGENKYAYPHCCDYVFHTKKKKEQNDKEKKDGTKEDEKDAEVNKDGEVSKDNDVEEENKVEKDKEDQLGEKGEKGDDSTEEESEEEKENTDENGKEEKGDSPESLKVS